MLSVEVAIDKSSMCVVDERRDDGMRDEDEKDKKEEVEREKLRLMAMRANHIRIGVLAWGFTHRFITEHVVSTYWSHSATCYSTLIPSPCSN